MKNKKKTQEYFTLISLPRDKQREWILDVIVRHDGNRSATAKFFGISKSTFHDRLVRLGISNKFGQSMIRRWSPIPGRPNNKAEAATFTYFPCVYVLSNPSYPGQYKIGKTKQLTRRLSSLNSGTPTPFTVAKIIFCHDIRQADRIEKKLHAMLYSNRCDSGREFFTLTKQELKELAWKI